MSDYERFKEILESENKSICTDSYSQKIIKMWSNYLYGLITEINISNLDANNIKIVVVKERLQCNAFVRKVGKTYFIAINDYILAYYKDLIHETYLNSENYEQLITFTAEYGSISEMNKIYFNPRDMVYYSFFNTPDIKYNTFANLVFNNILYMIIFHELGHVLGGHLEENDEDKNIFYELQTNETGNIREQGKELIADFYGVINTVRTSLIYNTDNVEKMTAVIALLKFSAWCMLSFFSRANFESPNFKISFQEYKEINNKFRHPPLEVRLYYITTFIEREVSFHLKQTFKPSWFSSLTENQKEVKINQMIKDSIALLSFITLKDGVNIKMDYKSIYTSRMLEYYHYLRHYASLVNDEYSNMRYISLDIPLNKTKEELEELEALKIYEELEVSNNEMLLNIIYTALNNQQSYLNRT